jgi:hypothetical protein
MSRRLPQLAGLIAIAVLGTLPALLLHRGTAPRGWSRSPREAPLQPASAPARWDSSASASLTLLRHVTAHEARQAVSALSSCEHSAAGRVERYRSCALAPLNRAQAFASSNSRMLAALVNNSPPTKACRGRVLALSGSAGLLAQSSQATRLSGLLGPWEEVLAASRSIRGLAREAIQQARGSDWATTCRPRPAAPKPRGALTI